MRIPYRLAKLTHSAAGGLKILRSPKDVACLSSSKVTGLRNTSQSDWKMQSPIDIDSTKAVADKGLSTKPLDFGRHLSAFNLTNTGSTVDAKTQSKYLLSGGPLANPYEFVGFHFHWENQENPLSGSEHLLNGKGFASELHLVHCNIQKYGEFAEALNYKDGLSVLGVFLEIAPEEKGHDALEELCSYFEQIKLKNASVAMKNPFCPYALLPNDTKSYWTYSGSLTTAPFSECVSWIVFKESIKISKSQLEKFRMLKSVAAVGIQEQESLQATHICHNVRETFPVGDRTVKASFV